MPITRRHADTRLDARGARQAGMPRHIASRRRSSNIRRRRATRLLLPVLNARKRDLPGDFRRRHYAIMLLYL